MYNLQIRTQVKEDVQEVVDYYDTISSEISDRFLEELYNSWDTIKRNPKLFQKKYRHTRVNYLRSYPFGVHYRVENETVIILGVIHTRRNPRSWLEKG